jgi:hypothetical protein
VMPLASFFFIRQEGVNDFLFCKKFNYSPIFECDP